MSPTAATIESPERMATGVSGRAFVISLIVHALLFFLMWIFGTKIYLEPLKISLLVENAPERVVIPEQIETETEPKSGRQKRKKSAPANSGGAKKGSKANSNAPATPDNPWGDYERQMFGRKSSDAERGAAAKSNGTSWGNEKISKTAKHGTEENVVIPKGDSSATTRWKKGGARRLISLPAIDYPESVRKKSGQGQVELLVEVGPDGRVEEVEIVKSSGYTRLDMNARNAYRNAVFSPSASGDKATGIIIVKFRMRDT